MTDKGDESAFPHVTHVTATGIERMAPGLTKREALEVLAMVGMIINNPERAHNRVAQDAEWYADAMLKMWEEREK